MKRTETSTPYLSWCLSIRNSDPQLLEQCLKSLRERTPQAEIVIVDNMSNREETLEVAKRYADVFETYAGPRGDWKKEDPHTYDMAASRTKAFKLASGIWRGWIDDDDRLPGPEEAEKLLKLSNMWKPRPTNSKIVESAEAPQSLEDVLRDVEKNCLESDCIFCPYLYAKDEGGNALVWQQRERIIKWSSPPRWRWAERAHEILCPVDGYKPKMKIEFSSLLFVHERKFSEESVKFAVGRHFDVLHKQYVEGDRTSRRSLYLAAYAQTLCPTREKEFIDSAHECATTPLDRYRSQIALAQMYVRQGMFMDALEAYGAACNLRRDLPDAWLMGAEAWIRAEDHGRAAEWLEIGIACQAGNVDSYINPRFQVIRYPTMLAETYQKIAAFHVRVGNHDQATAYLARAAEIAKKVSEHSAIGEDAVEAAARLRRVRNDHRAQAHAVNISILARYLIDNDEPKKALELLNAVPWNLQDHPLILEIEDKLKSVQKHITDPVAYNEFYNKEFENGYISSPDVWLDIEQAVPRARYVANWVLNNKPEATILDVGCFDGIIGIPLMRACPGIKYVGVDIYQKSLDVFKERLKRFGLEDRATLIHVDTINELVPADAFDIALWFEVIEHVPDPAAEMRRIIAHLKPGGRLFISTPWGSFDAGHPPELTSHGTPRDPRGHVRVLTARDCATVFDQAGLVVEDMEHHPTPITKIGDALHASAVKMPRSELEPVTFVVPGALWDWHGRQVRAQGMGASEKSIVQIAECLAAPQKQLIQFNGESGFLPRESKVNTLRTGEYYYAEAIRKVEVYGPVPDPDVFRGVAYWPKDQLRHVKSGKLIVSRSPGYVHTLNKNEALKPLKKILWLQDAYYPDLNPHVAELYERIVVVSEWHKNAMHELHGVPLNKMTVIYNPIEPQLYAMSGQIARKKDRFIYCSSPDRALIPLLRMWPKILERLPDATLDIYYGWRGCEKLGMGSDANWTKRYQEVRREFEKLRYQKGVTLRDMVDPVQLAIAFMTSGVWAYPCYEFTETCCTNSIESRAAGCVPVAPPTAALDEVVRGGGIRTKPSSEEGYEEDFLDAVVKATKIDADRTLMSKIAIEQNSVERAREKWKELLD